MKTLLITASLALALTGSARADPLPPVYLGKWCFKDSSAVRVATNDGCPGDGLMDIRRDRVIGHEMDCKIRSIRRTGKSWPASTAPRKADMIPEIRMVVRCGIGDDQPWTERMTLRYAKGVLTRED